MFSYHLECTIQFTACRAPVLERTAGAELTKIATISHVEELSLCQNPLGLHCKGIGSQGGGSPQDYTVESLDSQLLSPLSLRVPLISHSTSVLLLLHLTVPLLSPSGH